MPENGLVRVLLTSFAPFFAAIALLHKLLGLFVFVVWLAILWRPRAGASLVKALAGTNDLHHARHLLCLAPTDAGFAFQERRRRRKCRKPLAYLWLWDHSGVRHLVEIVCIYISRSLQFYCPGFMTFSAFSLICVWCFCVPRLIESSVGELGHLMCNVSFSVFFFWWNEILSPIISWKLSSGITYTVLCLGFVFPVLWPSLTICG